MSEVYHVVPVNDTLFHETESMDDCACQPRIEKTVGGWVSIHHAWDGRE